MAELKRLAAILLFIAALMLARAAKADIYIKENSQWIEDRKGTGTQFDFRIGREKLSFQGWVDEYPGTYQMWMRYLAAVYVDAIYSTPAWIESNTADYCSEYYLTLTWCANMSQPSTCSVVLDDALLYNEYPASLYLVPTAGSGVSYYLKKLQFTKNVVLSRFTNLRQETGTGVLGAANGWVYGMKAQFGIDYAAGYRSVGPPPQATLTVQVYRVDASGNALGAANGTKVNIGNTIYTADSSGKVSVTVNTGSTVSVQILDTYYRQNLNVYWRRYTFWKWSDGSTSNPRSFTVNQDTTVTAYVWDERLLLVLYEPRYGSDPWGVKALQLPDRYSGYVGQMLPWNASFWLRSGESFALQAVEGGAARFLRWDTATECYPRNPYTTNPVISLTMGGYGLAVKAAFRLGPSNQTLYLPGEGIPVPMFWPVYQQYVMGGCDGRKGAWLLNVTALTTQAQTAFAGDNRTWIYALLVNSSSILESVWVPVNGSWRLYMDKDWSAVAHKLDDCTLDNPYADACRYVAYDTSSISDFPQVVSGTPSKYRGWRLIGLAAWKPLLPNESYSAGAINAVWSGSATYALYNVTFKHVDSGWVYWQPVAVSALKIESATAKYQLSSYDSQLRRSPIYMWIEAVVNWTYVPPNAILPSLPPNVTLWMAGFKPHRIGNAGVALETDAGVVVWAPRGSAHGSTGKLYTLALGDTETFYNEPKDLNQGSRGFRLVVRFVARAAQPGVRVDDGIPVKAEVSFTLAPSTAVISGWLNNDPWKLVIDWDCFRSGSIGFNQARMGINYRADLYYEWGQVDPYNGTLSPLGRRALNSVYPTALVSDVDPDYWVAFYPIPAGNQYSVAPNSVVPVPLPAKYPPRAKGG